MHLEQMQDGKTPKHEDHQRVESPIGAPKPSPAIKPPEEPVEPDPQNQENQCQDDTFEPARATVKQGHEAARSLLSGVPIQSGQEGGAGKQDADANQGKQGRTPVSQGHR